MSTGQPSSLGPSTSIEFDRSKARSDLVLALACLGLGPAGVFFGQGDLAGGSTLIGAVFAGGGAFLFAYGAWLAYSAVRRLRNPQALVVGRDGFHQAGGTVVGWEEVAGISDPLSPAGKPRIVRVQLVDPRTFAGRHGLGLLARRLTVHGGDLLLGRDMAMPVAEVEALMRKRLAEYRKAPSGSLAPRQETRASGPRAPGKRG